MEHGHAETSKKESMACRLSLNHLHFPLLLQMLNENIQVASLITDSLQQKIYSMALEELEAFLGRSVEPPTPLSTLTNPGAMAKCHGLVVEICSGAPNAPPGHTRLSSLSTHGAAVSAFGGISSQGLLPHSLSAGPSQGDPEWVPLSHPAQCHSPTWWQHLKGAK